MINGETDGYERYSYLISMKKQGQVTTADVVGKTGFSRAYAQRFLKNLAEEGKIVRLGKANQAHYILLQKEERLRQNLPE